MKKTSAQCGFTLVELLVVISILMILASITVSLFNPALQKRKANEAVLKSNTAKLCLALNSCGSLKDTAADCDTADEIGAQPLAAGQTITVAGAVVTITGNTVPASTCVYTCSLDFSTGVITNLAGVGCL